MFARFWVSSNSFATQISVVTLMWLQFSTWFASDNPDPGFPFIFLLKSCFFFSFLFFFCPSSGRVTPALFPPSPEAVPLRCQWLPNSQSIIKQRLSWKSSSDSLSPLLPPCYYPLRHPGICKLCSKTGISIRHLGDAGSSQGDLTVCLSRTVPCLLFVYGNHWTLEGWKVV